MPKTGLQKRRLKTQKNRLKTGVLGCFSLFFQPLEKSSQKVPILGKKSAEKQGFFQCLETFFPDMGNNAKSGWVNYSSQRRRERRDFKKRKGALRPSATATTLQMRPVAASVEGEMLEKPKANSKRETGRGGEFEELGYKNECRCSSRDPRSR